MGESLRDQLTANFDKIITVEAPDETPAAPASEPASTPEGGTGAPPQSKIVAAPKEDERARDPKTGQFVEKSDEPKTAAAPAKPGTTPPPSAGTQPQGAAAAPIKPKPARPSSWKKDYWGHWDKMTGGQPLTPEEALALAEYMNSRETEFQHGVATYKREWEQAKPVLEAMQPFLPLLQQHNIQPQAWISNLGAAHRELALGTPQQKLARFAWLAQQYGVPVQALTDQTAQNEYLAKGGNGQNFQGQIPQNVLTREDADRLFQERFNAVRSEEDIQRFAADKEKYPYFEELRETMALRLDAGLSQDLDSAYQGALRDPRHSNIWDAIQEQKRAQDEEAKQRAEAERLSKAKGKAVSVRSATPSAPVGEKPKDRRSQLEENFDAIAGGGRV